MDNYHSWRNIMKRILFTYLIICTSALFARADVSCNDFNTRDELSMGTISVSSVDACSKILTPNPASGYKFAFWRNLYGTIVYDDTLEVSLSSAIQAGKSTIMWTATFVRSDAYIYEWTNEGVTYRSATTDVFNSSGSGTVYVKIDNGEFEYGSYKELTSEDYGIWSRERSSLRDGNQFAGGRLHLIFKDDCGQPTAVIDTIVPIVVEGTDSLASAMHFHSYANTDVQVLDGAILTIDADSTINGILDIHAGGKVIVEEGHTLTVNGIIMRGNGITKTWPQLVVDGRIINHNSDTIYYDYTIDNRHYYPLSLPYTTNCAAATNAVTGGVPTYRAYIYDTEKRAKSKSAWVEYNDMAPGAQFKAGKGYSIFSVPSRWNGTRQQHAIMRFPMVANFSSAGESTKIIDTQTDESEETIEQDRNWNFIGNPYLANITLGHTTAGKYCALQGSINESTGEFEPVEYGSRSIRYITYSTDGFETYEQVLMSGFELLPFNSYFTQTSLGDKLYFGKIPEGLPASAPRRASATDSDDIEELETGILLSQGDRTDHVGLLFGDFTDNYEINADLAKEFGSAQPMSAYSLMGTTPMAFQALSIDAMARPIPVGYRKAGNEQMTFSFDDNRYDRSLIDGLWLTDIVTGQVTNLLVEDYTFTPESAQDDSRFYLSCERRKVVDVTTDVEEIEQQRTIIRVFDMFGREMHGDINSLPQGVYVLMDNLGNTTKEILGQ